MRDLDDLWLRWLTRSETAARDRLVEIHMPLARELTAAAAAKAPADLAADLGQEAALALLKAVEDHDPQRGAFENHARFKIRRRLLDYLRTNDQAVPVSHRVSTPEGGTSRARRRGRRVAEQLTQRLARVPTVAELVEGGVDLAVAGDIASELSVHVDTVAGLPVVFDAAYEREREDGDGADIGRIAVAALASDAADHLAVTGPAELVAEAIGALPAGCQIVIVMHYRLGLGLTEMAAELGCSPALVSQMRDATISALQAELRSRPLAMVAAAS